MGDLSLVFVTYAGQMIMAGLAVVGGSVGLGILGNAFLSSIARQPELVGRLLPWFFTALALIEGLAIIVIAFSFVFPGLASTEFINLINNEDVQNALGGSE